VKAATGATSVHPYTDPRVIAGQGTAALELLTAHPDLDALVVPLGGGGLAAGTALAMRALAPHCQLYLAEPEGAADGARSFAKGALDHDFVPDTICDGLRGTLGAINFEILRRAGACVLTVDDAQVVAAMRQLWTRTKQLVEPSSATALAAVPAQRSFFEGRPVGILPPGGQRHAARADPDPGDRRPHGADDDRRLAARLPRKRAAVRRPGGSVTVARRHPKGVRCR